jgi:hypothetical protein
MKHKLIGVALLVICASLVALPVVAGFSMAGLHTGLVIFTGLGGLWLTAS